MTDINEAIQILEENGATIHKGTFHYSVSIYDYTIDAQQELELNEDEVIELCENYFS